MRFAYSRNVSRFYKEIVIISAANFRAFETVTNIYNLDNQSLYLDVANNLNPSLALTISFPSSGTNKEPLSKSGIRTPYTSTCAWSKSSKRSQWPSSMASNSALFLQ